MKNSHSSKIFLKAEWEYLLMLNYEVAPEILKPFIPPFTELDLWNGKAIVSLVGFLFNHTKVLGIQWPFHTHFEEVNLRLYVKYFDGKEWKRGVAFISEIVPKHLIAWIANLLYNEHYRAMPMKNDILITANELSVEYSWKYKRKWNRLQATATNTSFPLQPGTEEEFILEHYWGYNQLKSRCTIEYGVEHPQWEVYPVKHFKADYDIEQLYGKSFLPYLSASPQSVFLARGSEVIIRKPHKINNGFH